MKKFINAYNGLKRALKHKSVRIQIILGVLTIIFGFVINLDYYEWMFFIILIGLVITIEIFNTVIEFIGNYLSEEYDDKIKVIKDVSASAVLILCLTALIICIMAILRRIL